MNKTLDKSRLQRWLTGAVMVTAFFCGMTQDACAQEMTIGSDAPKINIEHWMSNGDGNFDEVTEFEKGKVYVVEFWATWCGPCIASMPHLAELQKDYADKGVQIISVSDEDVETVEKFLKRKVRGNKDGLTYGELTSAYCLTTDPDDSVSKDDMRAFNQNGIPTAFIVGKTGKVEWVGHPMEMDDPLKKVVGDQWDREDFRVAFEKEQELAKKQMAIQRSMMKVMEDVENEKYKEALAKLEKIIEDIDDEDMAMELSGFKLEIYAEGGMTKEYAKLASEILKSKKTHPMMVNTVAWGIYELAAEEKIVDKELIETARAASEKAVDKLPKDFQAATLDTVAHLYYLQGKKKEALKFQEKAYKLASDEEKEQLEEFLEQLRKELK